MTMFFGFKPHRRINGVAINSVRDDKGGEIFKHGPILSPLTLANNQVGTECLPGHSQTI